MRIVSGKHKNKKILTAIKGVIPRKLRPSTEKMRQAIFNTINHNPHLTEQILQDSVVLDLFCGSGALGIEALSRGSKFVTFVDKEPSNLMICKNNIAHLNENDHCEFISCNACKINKFDQRYNIVFIDPPYDEPKLIHDSLLMLANTNCLAKVHIIIIEHNNRITIDLPTNYILLVKKVYGASQLSICKYVDNSLGSVE